MEVQSTHYVKRWSGTDIRGYRRNISEHTFEVMMFTRVFINALRYREIKMEAAGDIPFSEISESAYYHILEYAMMHDLAEGVTNDVSYTVKRDNPDLVKILDKLEAKVLAEEYDYAPAHSRTHALAQFIVKLADNIAVGIEIADEVRFNNFTESALDPLQPIYNRAVGRAQSEGVSEWIIDCCRETYDKIMKEYGVL